MITATQLKAARALLDVDQRELAELANLSVPTIQRMEGLRVVAKMLASTIQFTRNKPTRANRHNSGDPVPTGQRNLPDG